MPRKQAKKKAAKRIPICPECGSASVDSGHPWRRHFVRFNVPSQAGKAILADREEWEGMTEWYCKTCGCDWGKHSRRFKKPGGVNATRSS